MKDLNACFLIPRYTHRYTAARYWQYADKTRYVVVYGIAPDVKILLMNDVKNTFFCCKFDKTAPSQVKNQYDGYVTYFS